MISNGVQNLRNTLLLKTCRNMCILKDFCCHQFWQIRRAYICHLKNSNQNCRWIHQINTNQMSIKSTLKFYGQSGSLKFESIFYCLCLIIAKVLKCLNQCFAQLRSQKSVSSKTAVDPASRFPEFEILFLTWKSYKTLI